MLADNPSGTKVLLAFEREDANIFLRYLKLFLDSIPYPLPKFQVCSSHQFLNQFRTKNNKTNPCEYKIPQF